MYITEKWYVIEKKLLLLISDIHYDVSSKSFRESVVEYRLFLYIAQNLYIYRVLILLYSTFLLNTFVCLLSWF